MKTKIDLMVETIKEIKEKVEFLEAMIETEKAAYEQKQKMIEYLENKLKAEAGK